MSSLPISKRARDEVDAEVEILSPAAKAAKSSEAHPTHPFFILEHLVRTVLPEKCGNENVKAFYKLQLEHPDATIEECKSKLASWVLKLWDRGNLLDFEKLKRHAATDYPRHSAVYLIILKVDDQHWRYAGQTEDCHTRIIDNHKSESYRNSRPKFLYFLHKRAEEVFYLLPVSDPLLKAGPVHNILEQWISLIFLALQPSELKHNLATETLRQARAKEMNFGANVREPLAQGFTFPEFPMRGASFKYSPDSVKREWFEIHQSLKTVPRRSSFLDGNVFQGSFWNASGWYGKADYEFQIWSVKLQVGRSWIDRCGEDTIRVWCDLRPEGETHPDTIIRGLYSPPRYEDPARRLGIKVSGIRKGDGKEGWCWIQVYGDSDKRIPQLNRLVDWLDNKDTEELRPRRWYPSNAKIGRPSCGYTRHPSDVGDAWQEIVKSTAVEGGGEEKQPDLA